MPSSGGTSRYHDTPNSIDPIDLNDDDEKLSKSSVSVYPGGSGVIASEFLQQ